jgi:hypothetical protein
VPNGKAAEVARMLKAIHAQEEDRKAAQAKAAEVVSWLKELKRWSGHYPMDTRR